MPVGLLRVFVFVACASSQGCVAPLTDTVERAGELVDEALDAGHSAFCSGRASLRAYQAFMQRHAKSKDDMVSWCGWDRPEVLLSDPAE